jgi:glutathione S-transferase
MLQLHYFPGNASLIPHIVLEELGVPFELKYVDRAVSAHKSPEYLALNPNGLIPVLVDTSFGGAGKPLVLYETAAVCLHLADTHPVDRLLPPLGTAERAQAYKWLAWLGNTLQSTLALYFYPDRWGGEKTAAEVKASAEAKVGTLLDQLDTELARHGGPWLLGGGFSVCDPYAFVLCRWTRGFGRPARSLPHLQPYLARMLERPAVQRSFATDCL